MVDINTVINSVNISCIEGLLRQIEIGLLQDSSLHPDFLAYIGLTLSNDLAWLHGLPWLHDLPYFNDLTPPDGKKEPISTLHKDSIYTDAKSGLDIEKEKRACDDELAEALIDHGDEILEKACEKKSELDIKEEKSNCDKKEEKKSNCDNELAEELTKDCGMVSDKISDKIDESPVTSAKDPINDRDVISDKAR